MHHGPARKWFESEPRNLATCPITQGTLLRFLIREGLGVKAAADTLSAITSQGWHTFWPDDIAFDGGVLRGVVGHRQVTDAYLVALAGNSGGRVATLDRGLAAVHGEVVELVAVP